MSTQQYDIKNNNSDNAIQYNKNDTINIKELFQALWNNKLIIISITITFLIIASVYALLSQEWWSADSKVIKPRINDYSELNLAVMNYQPIFESNMSSKQSIPKENPLIQLTNSKTLFEQFIQAFNSTTNKKEFLNKNEDFNDFYKIKSKTKTDANSIISHWYSKIKATPDNSINSRGHNKYILSFQSYSKESSFKMLTEYTSFISNKVRTDIIDGVNKTILAKNNELKNKQLLLLNQSKEKLNTEKQKTMIALKIAKESGIRDPIANLNNNELFSISLGENALESKISALNTLDNLSYFEPSLIDVNAKLKRLSAMGYLNNDLKFNTYRYIDSVEMPTSMDKPKRVLIVIFGLIIGFIISFIFIILKSISHR